MANGSSNRDRHRFLAAVVFCIGLGVFLCPTYAKARQAATVGPGDSLKVVVFGEENVANVLSGEFRVETDGSMEYPLLGQIAVAGKSPADIADLLEEALSLQVQITATVSVAEYAPVFLLGEVNKTGPYQYAPGMTLFELLLNAGGVSESEGSVGAKITAEQQVSILQLRNDALRVQKARLLAEANGTEFDPTSIDFASEAAELVAADTSVFEVHKRASASRRMIFDDQRRGYEQEITSITKSTALHDEEVELLEEQLRVQEGLTERGLAAQSALREMKRQLTATRREALEFRTALFRARQNRLGVDQALAEAEGQTMSETLDKLRETELSLAENLLELAAAKATLERFPSDESAAENALGWTPHYTLTRLVNGRYQSTLIEVLSPLERGDIVKVTFAPPPKAKEPTQSTAQASAHEP